MNIKIYLAKVIMTKINEFFYDVLAKEAGIDLLFP